MNKAIQRLHCSCGWEKWVDFDSSLTNEQAIKQTQPILDEHMDTHGQKNGDMVHLSHKTVTLYDYKGKKKIIDLSDKGLSERYPNPLKSLMKMIDDGFENNKDQGKLVKALIFYLIKNKQ